MYFKDHTVEDGLKYRSTSTYKDILGVLELDGGDDSGGNHNLLPGLGEVDVVNTLFVSLEDVAFHHFGAVVCSQMDLSDTLS